jgi:hypothetical protein
MNYNTEVINEAAEAIVGMLEAMVQEQREEGGKTPRIAQVENEVREMLRQIGQEALRLFLNSQQGMPSSEMECRCGGRLKYQRMRPATVISVFGKVGYERAYYGGCECGKGLAPVDEAFGIEPGHVTAGLGTLLALAGIAFSYEESAKWLGAYLLFDISENTVRSETEKMGALQEEQEGKLIARSQEYDYVLERRRQSGTIPARLYGSIDAAKVRIEPRPKKGEEKEEHEDWRDMKVLCWFETEEVSPAQRSARHRVKIDREQLPLRAKNMSYFCDVTEAATFGNLLWATGCAVLADVCPDLVFLGDGAIWIWNLVDHHYPHAVQIVDWYHAEEHLETVARDAFSSLPDQTAWLEQTTQSLWDGDVEDVIRSCQSLASVSPEASLAVTYFSNNRERMRYHRFRAAGYMIGSGTIESGCKQIVSHRLKLPGAQWEVDGAVYTAKARAVWLSGSWQPLCAQRSALPLAA